MLIDYDQIKFVESGTFDILRKIIQVDVSNKVCISGQYFEEFLLDMKNHLKSNCSAKSIPRFEFKMYEVIYKFLPLFLTHHNLSGNNLAPSEHQNHFVGHTRLENSRKSGKEIKKFFAANLYQFLISRFSG